MTSVPLAPACSRFARKATVVAVGCLATIGLADAARADCAPVLAAYANAEATKRYAVYEVDALGERKSAAAIADGFRIRNHEQGDDYTAIALWIDRSTALPLFHGLGSDAGVGWKHGADVVPPTPVRN